MKQFTKSASLKRLITRIISICILLSIVLTASPSLSAASVTILNKNYAFINTESLGTNTIETFTISLTIKNNQQTPLNNITIKLIDQDDLPLTEEISFTAEETKTIQFENYFVSGTGEHIVNISIFPTDEPGNVILTDSMILVKPGSTNTEGNDSPGFTLPLLLIIFALILIVRSKYKK